MACWQSTWAGPFWLRPDYAELWEDNNRTDGGCVPSVYDGERRVAALNTRARLYQPTLPERRLVKTSQLARMQGLALIALQDLDGLDPGRQVLRHRALVEEVGRTRQFQLTV